MISAKLVREVDDTGLGVLEENMDEKHNFFFFFLHLQYLVGGNTASEAVLAVMSKGKHFSHLKSKGTKFSH